MLKEILHIYHNGENIMDIAIYEDGRREIIPVVDNVKVVHVEQKKEEA